MEQTPATLDDLAAHAHQTHVVVVGGGIAGLVAALTCAKVGLRVSVVEASARLGGAVHTVDLGGLRVDVGAEGYATRDGAVRALVDELALTDAVIPAAPRDEWIAGLPGSAPVPAATLRGIPENAWDESVRRFIGWRGAWRAYLDRVRPPLTIGQERSLGVLVRRRMGAAVLERLVAPLSLGAFAIHPDDVDVEAAAPGLSSALTRTGSLAGAVAQLRADAAPGGFEGLDGGMSQLIDALHARLVELDVRIVTGTTVRALERGGDGRWTAVTAADPDGAGDADPEAGAMEPAHAILVATGADDAHRLLAPHAPALTTVPTVGIEVVTLVLALPQPDAGEYRTAVYPVRAGSRAASVTDSTARWPWLRRAAGADVRVVKVTFGGPDTAPATAGLDDAAAAELALAEASALLEVSPDRVFAAHRARYAQPPPGSALGHGDRTHAARAAVRAVPGLSATGAWIAGTGLAQVVPDAIAEAEHVRRTALWGGRPASASGPSGAPLGS